jgi:F-type H+-transporting ATPase subunit b
MIVLLQGSVLSIDGSFLFIFVSILCLIFILNRTLFKPINQILDEREKLGAGRLVEAKKMLAEYEARLANYEENLRVARGEAYQVLESSRKEIQASRAKMLAELKSEMAGQVESAKQDIARQTAVARENLEGEALAMAATISSHLLNRPVSAGRN